MSNKLLDCPFCGSNEMIVLTEGDIYDLENEYFEDQGESDDYLAAFCRGCKATGSFARTYDEAVSKWNTRSEVGISRKQLRDKVSVVRETIWNFF